MPVTAGGITFSGVYAATTTPLRDGGDVDFDEFAKHCAGQWDADPRFVQAIKLAQEEAGRYGGPVRLPRLPLPPDEAAQVRAAVRAALRATAEGDA